jgi:hypothetical protein
MAGYVGWNGERNEGQEVDEQKPALELIQTAAKLRMASLYN